jgi:hypothetical protein
VSAVAALVVALHFAFIAFVAAGGLLVLRWPRLSWLHLPALAWGLFIEVSGGICPLTPLENALRRAQGSPGYAGSFIEHWLVPLIYPPGLTRGTQLALAAALVLGNALVYARVIASARRGR